MYLAIGISTLSVEGIVRGMVFSLNVLWWTRGCNQVGKATRLVPRTADYVTIVFISAKGTLLSSVI